MTEQELRRVYEIKREIGRIEAQMREHQGKPGAEKLTRILREHQAKLIREKEAVLRYILDIEDDTVRLIAFMRFFEGKSWETIAKVRCYDRTSCAKILRKWLREHSDETFP